MGIPNPIMYFTLNDSLDHKSPISCLWTDLTNFFSLTWKFDGDSKSDIEVYLNCLSKPLKPNFISTKYFFQLESINFGIVIRCKINFDIIWYSVLFEANLYLLLFVLSSNILNFVFMNVVILFYNFIYSVYIIFPKVFH